MKNYLFVLFGMLFSTSLYSQTYFQNIYADSTNDETTMTVSPDAYYLVQNEGPPAFTPKILKIDLSGNLLWSKTITATNFPVAAMNIQYHNNSLLLTGAYQNAGYYNFFSKLDTAGNTIWSTGLSYGDINNNTRIFPLASGYLLCGHRDIQQSGLFTLDITLTRFDDIGNLVWARAFGNTNYDFTCAAAVITSNNDLMIAGNYGIRNPPSYDPMLARFDSSGNAIWMKTFSDTTNFIAAFTPTDMTATSDGNFALTGFSKNTNNNYDSQVLKIDGSGTILWAKRMYQISWQEYGNSIICDSQDNIVVAGLYKYLSNYGDFSAKFDLSGNLLGAAKISNTSRDHAILFDDIYRSRGGDLFERPGYGYAYSTYFYKAQYHSPQCIVTADYLGVLNCASLGGSYPFASDDLIWTPYTFPATPGYQTNISQAAVTILTSAITESQTDICSLVGLEDRPESIRFSLSPNPASQKSICTYELQHAAVVTISVTDITGKTISIINKGRLPQGIYEEAIATASLLKGVYLVSVRQDEKVSRTELIVY